MYHERATYEWKDLASAHCCLGDKMFDEYQDAESPCSIKPLAQTDPSHATTNLPRPQDPLPEYLVGAGMMKTL